MAIINNAQPGSDINLLCVLYRVIFRNEGKYTKSEIEELCAPRSLATKADQQKRLPENFDFWTQEGHRLWAPDASGKIGLTHVAGSDSPHAIAAVTNAALFALTIDDVFADRTKKFQTEELFQYISCLLASDRYLPESGEGITPTSLDELFAQYLPSSIPNNSEKPVIREYGYFLGYLEVDVTGAYVVDPTRVLRSILPAVFVGNREMPFDEFLSAAAKQCPLLDGGVYRHQVEKRLKGPVSGSADKRLLSRSLSLALTRLEYGQVLKLEPKSDDPNAWIVQFGAEKRSVSTVRLTLDGGEV